MKRARKPRHNPNKQKHDISEANHPIVTAKMSFRRWSGRCIGCGRRPCACKSEGKP